MEAATGDVLIPKVDTKLPLSLISGVRKAYRALRERVPEIESNVELIIRDLGTLLAEYNGASMLNPAMLIVVHQLHRRFRDDVNERLEQFMRWSSQIADVIGTGNTRGALVLDYIRYDDLYHSLQANMD